MEIWRLVFVVLVVFAAALAASAQQVKVTSALSITHTDRDFPVADLKNEAWDRAEKVDVRAYWSGEMAPAGRHFAARLLWTDKALYVRFDAAQTEPLVVSDRPELGKKTLGLWDRDVCEIFIAPDDKKPNNYFEFEIAPTGEWVDLGIEVRPDRRVTDWNYLSGMTSAARIEKETVTMAIRLEWRSLGKTPAAGDRWRGNLFRCVGRDPDRGYLAWQPTMTKEPAFHVPDKFGEFVFVK